MQHTNVRPTPSADPLPNWLLTPRYLRQRVDRLRWLAPAGLLLLVIINELGLARWVEARLGNAASVSLNILIYGSVGPVLAYLLLTVVGRWLEERETSEAQAEALHRARALAEHNHGLTDDALQTLFATSLMLDTLARELPNLSTEAAAQYREAEQAVNRAIEQLYANQKPKK
jgi:signal transduction histidine kinase